MTRPEPDAPADALATVRSAHQVAADVAAARETHREAHDELTRILAMPEPIQKRMRRLTARCEHGRPVVTVYATAGRLLLHLAGRGPIGASTDPREALTDAHAGSRDVGTMYRYAGRWLPLAGDVWRVDCGRGTHVVAADRVWTECTAESRRHGRTVHVASLAPNDMP